MNSAAKMRITKNSHQINSVDEWFALSPPKRGECQWKDGRSAKELAKAWFPSADTISIPGEFASLINSSNVLGRVELCEGWPEVAVRFDPFRGETRNCDLLLYAICSLGKVMISVEAKAHETFNETIGKSYDAAKKRSKSNAPARMRRLAAAILETDVEEIRALRYQLLYGTAAALSVAQQQNSATAMFVVHEFMTELTDDGKHHQNAIDLDRFVSALTRGLHTQVYVGHLLGPFRVPGNDDIPGNVDLYIGKAMRNTRPAQV